MEECRTNPIMSRYGTDVITAVRAVNALLPDRKCGRLYESEQNVVVEWLGLQLCIRRSRVQISTLRSVILTCFTLVSLAAPGECRDSTLELCHDNFLPHPFQVFIQLSSFHLTLYSLSY
jgi:hypothetical protein